VSDVDGGSRAFAGVVGEMFEELGVPTMTVALDSGAWADFPLDVIECAKLAGGLWWGPEIRAEDGRGGAALLAEMSTARLVGLLLLADPETTTEDDLRVAEWQFTLASDEPTARRFLDVLPLDLRDVAEGAAAHAWLYAGKDLETIGRRALRGDR